MRDLVSEICDCFDEHIHVELCKLEQESTVIQEQVMVDVLILGYDGEDLDAVQLDVFEETCVIVTNPCRKARTGKVYTLAHAPPVMYEWKTFLDVDKLQSSDVQLRCFVEEIQVIHERSARVVIEMGHQCRVCMFVLAEISEKLQRPRARFLIDARHRTRLPPRIRIREPDEI